MATKAKENNNTETDDTVTFEQFFEELTTNPATPPWAIEVLKEIGKPDATTIDVYDIRGRIRLVQLILERSSSSNIELWLQAQNLPDWMRMAMSLYRIAESRFAREHVMADLTVLDEVATLRIGFDDL